MPFTVAIDGPAAAGKGTISRAVAAQLGFRHLDTGLLYRATGARVLNGETAVAAARDLKPADSTGRVLGPPRSPTRRAGWQPIPMFGRRWCRSRGILRDGARGRFSTGATSAP